MARLRWTIADLDLFPEPLDDTRYEIIDGELYVAHQPSWFHQLMGGRLFAALHLWSEETGAGAVNWAIGLIFAEDDNVAPDLVWVSAQRLHAILWPDGKLHGAPDLVIEVLSPGSSNERRDREAKLMYSRRGVREYWIVSWQQRQIEIYRRVDLGLQLAVTCFEDDVLQSPLLAGFRLPLRELFAGLPSD